MVMQQDSSHPTGVRATRSDGNLSRARTRKSHAAIALRLAGASWSEVAVALGYPTARAALVACEGTLEKELKTQGDRNAMRGLAGARLERLLRSVWEKAISPDHPEHLPAVAQARAIIDRHAKLFGLDSPTEVVVHNPTQAELEAWVATVVSTQAVPVIEYDILDAEVEETDALEH